MNRILRGLGVVAVCIFLIGCGGQDEDGAAEKEKANNPLARQQQLIRDAKEIQGILDKDAERKKKALDGAN